MKILANALQASDVSNNPKCLSPDILDFGNDNKNIATCPNDGQMYKCGVVDGSVDISIPIGEFSN